MTEGIIVTIAVVVLLLFIVSEVPIWVGLLSSGAVGLLLLDGFTLTASALGTTAFSMVSNYSLFVIPMFILMGVLASNSGIAFDIYDVARRVTRTVPGGLGVATVLAAGGFSAVTGSSGATVATVGKVAVGEMTRNGYRANPSAALVAAGGTLGVLIPPSVILVIYGSLTTQSIGTLLLSAVVPGLLTLAAYAVTVVVLYKAGRLTADGRAASKDRPSGPSGSAGPDTAQAGGGLALARADAAPRTRVPRKSVAGTAYILLLFTIVIGGIYSGIFTATESGAIAAAVGVVILVVRTYHRGVRRTAVTVLDSFKEATAMSSMIFGLLIGGSVFSYFLVKSGLPSDAAQMVDEAGMSSYALLAVALLIMLVLGFFLDSLSILIIAIPLMYPIISAEGLDPIWFGILTVKAIEIGLLTPPFGINVFVALGTSKKTTLDGIFRSVLPFIVAEVVVILILIAFPSLTSFLPSLVGS